MIFDPTVTKKVEFDPREPVSSNGRNTNQEAEPQGGKKPFQPWWLRRTEVGGEKLQRGRGSSKGGKGKAKGKGGGKGKK